MAVEFIKSDQCEIHLFFYPQVTRGKVSGKRTMRPLIDIWEVGKREGAITPGPRLHDPPKDFRVSEAEAKIPTYVYDDIGRISSYHEDSSQ